MHTLRFLVLALLFSPFISLAQDMVEGKVTDEESRPLVGAYVFWMNQSEFATTTDSLGQFRIPRSQVSDTLVASMVGYERKLVKLKNGQLKITFRLSNSIMIEHAIVTETIGAKTLDTRSVRQVTRFTEKEFTKAACCNLSESFENISAVDVTTTDAVTGLKQIQMLGFSGIYIQTMVDNMPYATGLKAASGLTYIPGVFVKGMQLSKGVGSVTNGYDGMTGSLNIDLRKPFNKERLVLNGYYNPMNQRVEGNVIFTHQVTNTWATTTMLHGSGVYAQRDVNNDGIQDFPLQDNMQLSHAWMYMKGKWEGNFGVNYLNYNQTLESTGKDLQQFPTQWSSNHQDQRLAVHGMLGYVGSKEPIKSNGIRFVALRNTLQNTFGDRTYLAEENSIRVNAVRQTILGNTFHRLTFGGSYYANVTDEQLSDADHNLMLERREIVPGVFAELAETSIEKLVLVLGLRYDYHNFFGSIFTPRLHAKYQLTEHVEWRVGAGRGQRTANPLADYTGLYSANRRVVLPDGVNNGFYGLQQEVSWNFGTSLSKCFTIKKRPATIAVDYYYTWFDEQLQVDRDVNASELRFYNIKALGLNSFSHSASIEMDYAPFKRTEVRAAYRFIDSRSDFSDGVRRMNPLISPHRAFLNIAYETRSKWTFDFTVNWQSSKRLPQGGGLPEDLRDLPTQSPSYTGVMAQVLKKFKKSWEIYAGGENLLNIRQDNLIRMASNPESAYFDPTLIWGPSLGAMGYIGFRYYIR